MSFSLIASSFITLLLAFVMVLHPLSSPTPDGRLTVEFLDVGQGDSAFVAFPNGQTMLIDGGGRLSYGDGNLTRDLPRIGERVVSEFLWERGYSKIDYVVATHADADHMQGLADVVRNFAVGEVIFARSAPNDPEFAELQSRVRQSRVRTAIVGKNDALSIGGAHVEVLHPYHDDSENSISDNNASLVIRIKYGSRYFLFAGDIELAGENTLLNDRTLLKADVIKVPHHGSKTSSSQHFVDAVDPKVAVISVGRRSTFGHPSEDVVARWKASGAAVLTTGENGTITISTDGSELLVSSYLNGNER
jgi:competence protein ComEC